MKNSLASLCFLLSLLFVNSLVACASQKLIDLNPSLPKGFVYLHDLSPSIIEEIRYATFHNFTGRKVKGYQDPVCILTEPTAMALNQIQIELQAQSLTLKVYDCYRPTSAVDQFVLWAKDLTDLVMKAEFYPRENKENLFKDGYIAHQSGHSRGSTVDLTLVPLPVPLQEKYGPGDTLSGCTLPANKRFMDNSLDFGTGYDCFDPLAHTHSNQISEAQKANRTLLRTLMEKHGFKGIESEWWHYTLSTEPYPDRFFNFPVKERE